MVFCILELSHMWVYGFKLVVGAKIRVDRSGYFYIWDPLYYFVYVHRTECDQDKMRIFKIWTKPFLKGDQKGRFAPV